MPKPEQLLLGAATLVFLPMIVFATYLAVLAFDEGGRLAGAPVLVPGQGLAGTLYRLEGEVQGTLMAPKEFPEIAGALQIRAVRQTRREAQADQWVDDELAPVQTLRADQVTVAGVPIELNATTRIVAPIVETFHAESATARLHLHYRPIAGVPVVVFGHYEHGVLRDGTYDRVLLVTADQVAPTIAAAAASGRLKGVVLSVITLVMAGLAGLCLRAALKGRPD